MALADSDVSIIYNGLINKFLYKNDINCIHILLNLFELEEDITNICPKYITINNIKKRINRFLNDRKDNYFISLNLGQAIHEDINRLELYVYLEGYKMGYHNKFWANKLENTILKKSKIEELYQLKYLYHFEMNTEEVKNIKLKIFKELEKEEESTDFLYNIIYKYASSVLKLKIFNINNFLDKQLMIDYKSNQHKIKEDEDLLNFNELNNIYKETIKVVYKTSVKLYEQAYWYGINDRVLNRYK